MFTHLRSPLRLVLTVVAVAVGAVFALTAFFWALDAVVHLVGWVVRIVVLSAVAATVWHYVSRRLARRGERF